MTTAVAAAGDDDEERSGQLSETAARAIGAAMARELAATGITATFGPNGTVRLVRRRDAAGVAAGTAEAVRSVTQLASAAEAASASQRRRRAGLTGDYLRWWRVRPKLRMRSRRAQGAVDASATARALATLPEVMRAPVVAALLGISDALASAPLTVSRRAMPDTAKFGAALSRYVDRIERD